MNLTTARGYRVSSVDFFFFFYSKVYDSVLQFISILRGLEAGTERGLI